MSKVRYDILSPDGISIDMIKTYKSKEEAERCFKKWLKRYEQQGYYSCRGERIPLSEVESYCKLIEV